VEADLGCSSLKVLTEHAVLWIGSFELAPEPGIFAILDFHAKAVQIPKLLCSWCGKFPPCVMHNVHASVGYSAPH